MMKKKRVTVSIDINEGQKYDLRGARIVGNVGGMATELEPLLSKLHLMILIVVAILLM